MTTAAIGPKRSRRFDCSEDFQEFSGACSSPKAIRSVALKSPRSAAPRRASSRFSRRSERRLAYELVGARAR